MRTRSVMVLVGLIACGGSRVLCAQGDAAMRARIDTFLTRAAGHGLSGTVLVARGDSVVLLKAYGMAERAENVRLSVDDPYFIGSVGKQFTAAAVMRLIEDGLLSATDSVKRFFPEAPPASANLTIGQLLSHTSGLPYLPTHGLFGEGTRDSVMREMLAEPVEGTPGSQFAYSSAGFTLLAGIIERASRMSYESYLERRLFRPAGLTNTGFVADTARWRSARIRSYSDDAAEPRAVEVAAPRMVGAGSIIASVPDLFRWYQALIHGRIIAPRFVDSLFAPRIAIGPTLQGAYAWRIAALPTTQLRLVAGDIGGFNAEIRHYVGENLIVVFASNRRTRGLGDREFVMNAVARLSRGQQIPIPPAVRPSSREERARFAGSYDLRGGGTIRVDTSADAFVLVAADSAAIASVAPGDTTRSGWTRRLELETADRAVAYDLFTDRSIALLLNPGSRPAALSVNGRMMELIRRGG